MILTFEEVICLKPGTSVTMIYNYPGCFQTKEIIEIVKVTDLGLYYSGVDILPTRYTRNNLQKDIKRGYVRFSIEYPLLNIRNYL